MNKSAALLPFVILLSVVARSACAQPRITNMQVSASTVSLQWHPPTNRFIVEEVPALGVSWALSKCVLSSTGTMTSTSDFAAASDSAFYRITHGLQAIPFVDPVFETAVIESMAAKLPPFNRVYDTEVGLITNVYHWGETVISLGGIEFLFALRSLTIEDNDFSDVSAVSAATNLQYLVIRDCALTNIAALSTLVNLRHLKLTENHFSDLEPLTGLTNLEHLEIAELGSIYTGFLSDIAPIGAMRKLITLDISDNAIADLGALSALTNIVTLDISDNQVSSLTPLSEMAQLIHLNCRWNQVADLGPLVENALSGGIGLGTMVDVRDNPLTSYVVTNQIPTLQSLGVTVISE